MEFSEKIFYHSNEFRNYSDLLMNQLDENESGLKWQYGNVSYDAFSKEYDDNDEPAIHGYLGLRPTEDSFVWSSIKSVGSFLFSGFVLTIYHLSLAIFWGLPQMIWNMDTDHFSVYVFFICRDLQEALGHVLSIFDKKYGEYLLAEADSQKTCYTRALRNIGKTSEEIAAEVQAMKDARQKVEESYIKPSTMIENLPENVDEAIKYVDQWSRLTEWSSNMASLLEHYFDSKQYDHAFSFMKHDIFKSTRIKVTRDNFETLIGHYSKNDCNKLLELLSDNNVKDVFEQDNYLFLLANRFLDENNCEMAVKIFKMLTFLSTDQKIAFITKLATYCYENNTEDHPEFLCFYETYTFIHTIAPKCIENKEWDRLKKILTNQKTEKYLIPQYLIPLISNNLDVYVLEEIKKLLVYLCEIIITTRNYLELDEMSTEELTELVTNNFTEITEHLKTLPTRDVESSLCDKIHRHQKIIALQKDNSKLGMEIKRILQIANQYSFDNIPEEDVKNRDQQLGKALKALCGLELDKTNTKEIEERRAKIQSDLYNQYSSQNNKALSDFYWTAMSYLLGLGHKLSQ